MSSKYENEYEIETGKCPYIQYHHIGAPSLDYLNWLIAKLEYKDRRCEAAEELINETLGSNVGRLDKEYLETYYRWQSIVREGEI